MGIGLRGVFELIRETRDTNPSLCVRALQALLDMLQGQTPEGLKTEPPDVMGECGWNNLKLTSHWGLSMLICICEWDYHWIRYCFYTSNTKDIFPIKYMLNFSVKSQKYLYFTSFLTTETSQSLGIISQRGQKYPYFNIIAADGPVIQVIYSGLSPRRVYQ